MDIEQVKSRIRKLLALAESPNENEATAAAVKAQRQGNDETTALVDVKKARIDEWVKENLELKTVNLNYNQDIDTNGVLAGDKAAETVNLNRPIEGGSQDRAALCAAG